MYVYIIWCLVCRNIFHLFDLFLQRSDRSARQEVEDELGHERMRTFGSTVGGKRIFHQEDQGAGSKQPQGCASAMKDSSPAHSHHLYIIYGQHPFNDLAPRLSFQKEGGWTASVAMTPFIEALSRISGPHESWLWWTHHFCYIGIRAGI